MDEFFKIEKNIGEIAAVVGLQFTYEKEYLEEKDQKFEKFEKQEVIVEKKSDEEEQEEVKDESLNEEKKVPKFKKEDFTWTISDRNPRNLPQLFV